MALTVRNKIIGWGCHKPKCAGVSTWMTVGSNGNIPPVVTLQSLNFCTRVCMLHDYRSIHRSDR
jgi:hypothetical protein